VTATSLFTVSTFSWGITRPVSRDLSTSAALRPLAQRTRIVCVVSGGNIDASTLAPILVGETPRG
jgi:hypothetical protein